MARTRHATDVFWKGSSSNLYFFAGSPLYTGSMRVPTACTHKVATRQPGCSIRRQLHKKIWDMLQKAAAVQDLAQDTCLAVI